MSDYKFDCPRCGQSLEAPEEMMGEAIDCPSCNGQIQIPKPAQPDRPRTVARPSRPAISTPPAKSKRNLTPLIVAGFALLIVGGVATFFIIAKDPHKVEVPSSVEKWDNEDLHKAVEKLPEKEKELFAAYAARAALATAFGGEGVIPEGKTVGDVIKDQRKWQKEQEDMEQKQALLAAKLLKEQQEARTQMNNAVTASLLEISWHKSDWERGIHSDYFAISIGFKNCTAKDIAGIKGTVIFKDIFGDLIKGVRLSNDSGVAAGDTAIWNGSMDYNQFDDSDSKLRNTSRDKLKFEWEPDTYLFVDGTKMTMPKQGY